MRIIEATSQFKRDAKKYYSQLLYNPNWFEILNSLIADEVLHQKYKDHQLTGNLKEYRDCHVQNDLVLLYQKIEDRLILCRIGTHSELCL